MEAVLGKDGLRQGKERYFQLTFTASYLLSLRLITLASEDLIYYSLQPTTQTTTLSLAQELASVEDYDMPDLKYDSNGEGFFTKEGYEKLQRIIQKQDAKSKEMQTFINKSKQAMNNLNEQLQNAG
ncbi:hypothetical protein COL940_013831 [Colletotrichum noveboracense]|nr:hypothetical protein COL940_013831 [Colletotrichum noveboracense]